MTKRVKYDYPVWVCFDCGEKYGRRKAGLYTVHPDTCGVCGEHKMVTEPRDFGHLREDWVDGVPKQKKAPGKARAALPPSDAVAQPGLERFEQKDHGALGD